MQQTIQTLAFIAGNNRHANATPLPTGKTHRVNFVIWYDTSPIPHLFPAYSAPILHPFTYFPPILWLFSSHSPSLLHFSTPSPANVANLESCATRGELD
jgi:hypothetical protein